MGLSVYNTQKILIDDIGGEIVTAHNGVTGESVDVLIYVKNDNPAVYYTDVEATPNDSDFVDDTLGVYGTGRGFKLSVGSRQPTETEWDNVIAGDFVIMTAVGTTAGADTTTFFPLWMRVIVPGNTEIQTFNDVNLVVTATERIVGS
jgi:hypothetical protein